MNNNVNAILPGTELNGYVFNKEIGVGGFSTVYLVRSVKFEMDFVAKVIHKKLSNTDIAWKSYLTETTNLCKLDHPNIIRLYEAFPNEDSLIIILEYCPGGSLLDLVRNKGVISEKELFSLMVQVVDAMIHLTKCGIVHHDIKPQNILLDPFNRPKLADFGLSSKAGSDKSHLYQGTWTFLAPEVIKKTPYDPIPADIWSLGVTMFFCLTGRLPFLGTTVKELETSIVSGYFEMPSNISSDCSLLIRGMLQIVPSKRYSLQEIRTILQEKKSRIPLPHLNSVFSEPKVNLQRTPLRKPTTNLLIVTTRRNSSLNLKSSGILNALKRNSQTVN